MALVAALLGGLVLDSTAREPRAGDLLGTIALNIVVFIWIRHDSRERGYKLHSLFPYVVVIFGLLALIYYLFRSRGFPDGLFSTGWMLLYGAALIIAATIVTLLIGVVLVLIGVLPETVLQ